MSGVSLVTEIAVRSVLEVPNGFRVFIVNTRLQKNNGLQQTVGPVVAGCNSSKFQVTDVTF